MKFKAKKEIFLTRGIGFHKEKLASYEEALRNAGIARFNLVNISSIFPPHCKLISRKNGLEKLESGQIVYCVMARNQTNEYKRLVSASVGLAIPKDPDFYGYLSEHEAFGQTSEVAGEYAEDLAASMLATVLGVSFNPDAAWDEKKEIWKISGKIIRTTNITQSGIGRRDIWTTVLAAAVFIL